MNFVLQKIFCCTFFQKNKDIITSFTAKSAAMLWKELVKNALLGPEHFSFNKLTINKLSNLGLDVSKEPSSILAEATALIAQLRKAGFMLQNFNEELPSPSAHSGANKATAKTAYFLKLMLTGPHSPVLPEFLYLLEKNEKLLPASELPALLHMSELDIFWPKIEPLLGEDGRWLLQQNPAWAARLRNPQNFDWQTGSREERHSQFKFWRKKSPKFALEMLVSSWDTESPADKANFIGLMAIGLSLDDEKFLEKCLDDRRKEVRHAASQLLPKLTSSSFSKRMVDRADSCFAFSGNTLKVNVLESLDLAALRDGLLHIHLGWAGGAQAGILGQLVSVVEPGHWEEYFQCEPAEVLRLFLKTDWHEALIRAVAEATVMHGTRKWAIELLNFWQKNDSLLLWELPVGSHLTKLISAAEVNQLALKFLKETTGLPTESSVVFRLLKFSEANWSHELSLLIVNRFRMEIVRDFRQIWQLQYLKEYLQMLGLRSDPNLFEQIQMGWSHDSVQWRMWEKPVEDMLALLLFRREMRQEIQSAAST